MRQKEEKERDGEERKIERCEKEREVDREGERERLEVFNQVTF